MLFKNHDFEFKETDHSNCIDFLEFSVSNIYNVILLEQLVN